MTMTLYQELKAAGLPIRSHCSDLYVPATKEALAIIKRHAWHWERFVNQVEGGLWIDVPSAYEPYLADRLRQAAL